MQRSIKKYTDLDREDCITHNGIKDSMFFGRNLPCLIQIWVSLNKNRMDEGLTTKESSSFNHIFFRVWTTSTNNFVHPFVYPSDTDSYRVERSSEHLLLCSLLSLGIHREIAFHRIHPIKLTTNFFPPSSMTLAVTTSNFSLDLRNKQSTNVFMVIAALVHMCTLRRNCGVEANIRRQNSFY